MKQNTWKRLDKAIFEALEVRQMMSVTPLTPATLNAGVLSISSDSSSGSMVQINFAGNSGQLQVNTDGQEFQNFPISQVKQFDITTGSGADYIYIDPGIDIPANVNSGDGNDTIHTGAGNDTIVAGNGNDVIYGKTGNNTIEVGSGNDTLLGDRGNDRMTAGNGNDYLVGGGGADVMVVGNGNDTFQVGSASDSITAGTGNDTVQGGPNYKYTHGVESVSSAPTAPSSSAPTSTGTTTPTTTAAPAPVASKTTTPTAPTAPKTTTPTTPVTTAPTTSVTTTSSTGTSSSSSTTTAATSPEATPPPTVAGPTATTSTSPVAIMSVLAGPLVTGMVVNVNGLTSGLGSGSPITSNYAWDFGDSSASGNQLTGYNSAHVYDQPGNYTITLTVTNNLGLVSTTTHTLTIAASTRAQIYVDSSAGSDTNTGSSTSPLKSLTAAFAKLNNNTEILLKAGETFDTTVCFNVNQSNVLIGRYGTGTNPTVLHIKGTDVPTFCTEANTNGFTIQDITFDSQFAVAANQQAPKNGVSGIYLGGQNLTVRDCTFLNVDDAINENGNPTGVLVQNNDAPLATGLRGYFVWGQGVQSVIVGNTVANSTREHVIRMRDLSEAAVLNNNFSNLDRTSVDPYDTSKGCIEVQWAQYAWIKDNTVTDGDIRLGPLGLWGEPSTSSTDNCVIEDNNLTGTQIFLQAGTHDAMITNNVINNNGGQAIFVTGSDGQGRITQDITINNNTGIDLSSIGNFVEVTSGATGIVLKNNLWVAPTIGVGSYGTAPVYAASISSFAEISGNVWPAPDTTHTFAAGGINFVGSSMISSNFDSPTQWNALSPVHGDVFENVTLNDTYQITIGSDTAGSSLPMAA